MAHRHPRRLPCAFLVPPPSRVGYELGFLLRMARPLWGVVLLSYLVVAQPPKLAWFFQREMPDSRQPFGAWFVRRLR